MTLKERYRNVIDWFSRNMPTAQTELHYSNAYELLVAVILSAQCTDKRVNQVTPALFRRFPDAKSMAQGAVDEIFELIKSCSFPNNKAAHLLGMAQMLTYRFDGKVPDNIEQLQQLPCVGRKTANVILAVIYNKPALAVDTHVFRVAHRLGIVRNANTPLEVEKQLTAHFPPETIPTAHHWLILHGRYVCTARTPKCAECGLTTVCTEYASSLKKKEK